MKNKRAAHGEIIERFQKKSIEIERESESNFLSTSEQQLPEPTDQDIKSSFEQVITSKKRANTDSLYDKKRKMKKPKRSVRPSVKDENYIPYQSSDKHTEDGLAINSFEQQAQKAEFSLTDKAEEIKFKPGAKKWDRIRKKMVPVQDPRAGKIRTESGIWIPATYKTGRYADWKEKTKIEEQVHKEFEDDENCKQYLYHITLKISFIFRISSFTSTKASTNQMGTTYGQTRFEEKARQYRQRVEKSGTDCSSTIAIGAHQAKGNDK